MTRIHDHLPSSIQVKGKTFDRHCGPATLIELGGLQKEKEHLRQQGYLVRTIHVLRRTFRGRTDFHGRPYKPNSWLFIHKKIKK
jgi:hypothetical protein